MKKRLIPITIVTLAIILLSTASACSVAEPSNTNAVDYATSIANIKTDLTNLTQTVNGLSTSVANFTGAAGDVATIKSSINSIQSLITTIQASITELNAENDAIAVELEQIKASYEELKAYTEGLETGTIPIIYIKPVLNSAGLALGLFSNVERTGSFSIVFYQNSPTIIPGATDYDSALTYVMSNLPFNVIAGTGIIPQPKIIKSGSNWMLYAMEYVTPITVVAAGESTKVLNISAIPSGWFVVVEFKSAAVLGGSSGW